MKKYLYKFFIIIFLLLIAITLPSRTYSENGNKAPDFTLESIDGKSITLKEALDGKKVLLIFWSTWCPYCVKEVPHVEKFHIENSDKVNVIGINAGESKAKVSRFVQKKGMTYKVALDKDGSVAKSYKVVGIPMLIVIDKDGSILSKGHSMEEVAGALK
ncbi:MAG: TlpA family protein disulfide reductase [Candidatus Aureabacteria bacterium]|nr:TlpA family protein disulfide reductase [Candidatus Auribacterota bacterium]